MKNLNNRIKNAFKGVDLKESKNEPQYNSWSLAHFMSTPNITKEQLHVEHPDLGEGVVTEMTRNEATIRWNRLGSWLSRSENINITEASIILVCNFDKYL